MAKAPLAVRLMHHAQREANRFRKVLKGKDPVKEAAEVLAGIPILYEAVRKYIPDIKLPRMTAERAALQAYATMVQQGRIGINRNGKTRRAGRYSLQCHKPLARKDRILLSCMSFSLEFCLTFLE